MHHVPGNGLSGFDDLIQAGPELHQVMVVHDYIVSERKLGFFVKVKEDQNFNRSFCAPKIFQKQAEVVFILDRS